MTVNHTRRTKRLISGLVWVAVLVLVACQTMRATGPFYTIRVRHISDFKVYEDHRVRLGEEFFIADTEYSAKAEEYNPDFAIALKTREVVRRSDKPLNPALRLAVSYQGQLLYDTWILYQSMTPHTIYEPGYYFQFISYEGEEPSSSKRGSN